MNKPSIYGFFFKVIFIAFLLMGINTGLQAQWEAVYDSNPNFPNLETVAFSSRYNGLAAGANGVIIRTDNSGLNWDTVLVEPNGLDIVDLQFTSPTTAFALAQSPVPACGAGDEGLIAQTNNYGATWEFTYTDTSLYAAHFPNANIGYVVGNCGAVYKTIDGGANWQWLNTGIEENLTSVFFINDQTGFVVGPNNAFWKTTDGGANWIDLDSAISGVNEYYEITFPTADIGYLSANGNLYKSTNAGENWIAINNPINGFSILSFVNEDMGWLGGNAGFYKTTDGGNSWESQNTSNGFFGPLLLDLFFLDENTGFVVGTQKYFKTTTGGESLPNIQYLSGNVFKDLNQTCTLDNGEPGLRNWIVRFTGNGNTTYTTTDSEGNYFLGLETGTYEIGLVLPNANWINGCQAIYNEILSSPLDTLILNLPAREAIICPVLEIDLSTEALKHNSNNRYTVRYTNTGTATAIAPYIEITLDDDLEMISTFWSTVSGNVYSFEPLPDLAVGESGTFSFVVSLNDEPIIGQTHSVKAEIYPNDFCIPPSTSWSEASLEVDALCQGDSVSFTIRNLGIGGMAELQEFVIIEDHVLFMNGNVNLGSDEDSTITLYPQGSTLRLQLDQVNDHPGRSNPSISVEACNTNTASNTSLGFVTQYPEDDANVFVSMDCQESDDSVASPPIKKAYPKGYGNEHFIEANVDLDYHILFQNNSTDTIYTVIVQDTLSQWLDASSVRQGAASHPYDFSLSGNGIAKFVFANIQLAPSEYGFIKYRVKQMLNNPDSVIIESGTCISYDYGLNNNIGTTTHVVGTDFMLIADTALITGVVENENGEMVGLVEVLNNWQSQVNTDSSGYYQLDNAELMFAYNLVPQKDTNLLNGVDVGDLYFIQKYIIMDTLLNSPYKKIAADIDNSGSITTLDVLHGKKAILGLTDSFPNNQSWRFIKSGYEFPDPENPFANAFPESFTLNTPTTNNVINFTGIKIGDIDLSHNPVELIGAEEKDLEEQPIFIEEQELEEGRSYKVPLIIEGPIDLAALQFALEFDTTTLAFEGIDTDATTTCRSDNFGYRFLEHGVITACWFDQNMLEANQPTNKDIKLFQLRFTAKKDGRRLSNSIMLKPELVEGLTFERKDDLLLKGLKRKLTTLHFDRDGQVSTNVSHSALEIFPNPTSDDDLWIKYTLEEESTAKINVFNALGQLQSVQLLERRPKGTYTYKLDTSGFPEGSYFIHLHAVAPMVCKFIKLGG